MEYNAREASPRGESPRHLSFQNFMLLRSYHCPPWTDSTIKNLLPAFDCLLHPHFIPFTNYTQAPTSLFLSVFPYNHLPSLICIYRIIFLCLVATCSLFGFVSYWELYYSLFLLYDIFLWISFAKLIVALTTFSVMKCRDRLLICCCIFWFTFCSLCFS